MSSFVTLPVPRQFEHAPSELRKLRVAGSGFVKTFPQVEQSKFEENVGIAHESSSTITGWNERLPASLDPFSDSAEASGVDI